MRKNRVIQNAKWIIICKIVQSLLQLLIGMFSARYLGPSNYGLIHYAASIVAFAIPVMQLGLRSTLVQEFIEEPEKEGEIIGTSLFMNLVSAMACMVAISVFVSVANPGETDTLIVCILYGISLFFQAIEMVQYWFQYKLLSKYPSVVMLISYMTVSAYKIYLLLSAKSVYWFVLSYSIDYCVIGMALLAIYLKMGKQQLRFSPAMAVQLFSRGKYYIVSGLMVTIFANTDHVMLKMIVGETENGYYAAAITSAGIANFVYSAIIDSARPVILSSRKEGQECFEQNISRLYSIILYMGLAESIGVTLFAEIIVHILYGQAYTATIPVLRIVVWYIAFSYMGTVRNIWILAEGKQNLLWVVNLSGAVFNVVLNYILIPTWGACGAALASVCTQFFANFIIGFLIKPIRKNNMLIIRGLHPKYFIGIAREILGK